MFQPWRWGKWRRRLAALILIGLMVAAWGYWNATRYPIIRQATLAVAGLPEAESGLRVLLLSDIHVAGPDMPPERLERIVSRLNSLHPDLVLIAGDLASEKTLATHVYSPAEIVAPLGRLKARLGVIATPGNHDHWYGLDALEAELTGHGITLLKNRAEERGPLVILGVDDAYTGHDDAPATFADAARLPAKPRILLTHSPDVIPGLPQPVAVVLAGHTHCGQISLPLYGAISHLSRYGDRFACGAIDDAGQKVFVGAGLGTSIMPLRFGAPPDVWVITLVAGEP